MQLPGQHLLNMCHSRYSESFLDHLKIFDPSMVVVECGISELNTSARYRALTAFPEQTNPPRLRKPRSSSPPVHEASGGYAIAA